MKPLRTSRDGPLPVTAKDVDSDEVKDINPSRSQRGMSRRGILVAISYMICAVMLIMFNKAALSSYKFPCANVLTLLQMLVSNIVLFFLRRAQLITFSNSHSTRTPPRGFVSLSTLRQASPLALSYLFYMMAGMASLRGVSVPMYTSLRRTTVAFTMAMESYVSRKRHSFTVVMSVGIICGGAMIAGLHDLSFDFHGYLLVFISNLTTAIYLAMIAELGKATGLNSFGLMWCNGILCSPALLLWTIFSGEFQQAISFPPFATVGFIAVITMSCLLAFALNHTIFLNTSLNSPLTQTMCGNLKDFGTVACGWILFGGLPFELFNLIGQILGFMGSGLYAYSKLHGS